MQDAGRQSEPNRTSDGGRQKGQEQEARWSAWMARAQDGDRDAYGRLLHELCPVVEGFVRSRFGSSGGSGTSDFVEECVQEALLAVHRARHTYDPRRAFRPWLFTLVRHKAIDLLRRRRVRGHTEPVEGDEEHAPIAAETEDPSRQVDGQALLARLEPKYREALVLTKLDGYSMEEAARRAGVSVAAMKTRVHRALRSIQKRLAEEELA